MSTTDSTKPTIIGLYGISGSGKSYLLNELKNDTTLKNFAFYDGSEVIDRVTPGGLEAFKQLDDDEKLRYREAALAQVSNDCQNSQKTGVMSGHYMFWNPDKKPKHLAVGMEKDWKTYSHIIYLNTDLDLISHRCKQGTQRARAEFAVEELREWQKTERTALRTICREHGVFFTSIAEHASSNGSITLLKLKSLLVNFQQYAKASNSTAVDRALELALGNQKKLEKVLVFDADKTLAPQDTGALFWKQLADHTDFAKGPLTELFRGEGYSYFTFRQAILYYEEVTDTFDTVCDGVAANVEMYPEMITLLTRAAKEPQVRAVVVTCGRGEVWKKVLHRHNLSHVNVIGSRCLRDSYVITGPIKGHIVDKLHEKKLRVLAFGDSPLDIEMLKKADQAYVVVGESNTRSRSMEEKLKEAIAAGLGARQVLLPEEAEPRLDLEQLPRFTLNETSLYLIFKRPFLHATGKNIAKLLQTSTRDARVAGHKLRQAHENIGHYLAMEYLSDLLDVEEYKIPHVQGEMTDGYRFWDEAVTLIVPLMRGGEPMAFGVSKALRTAAFAHAYTYKDFEQDGEKRGKVEGNLEGKKVIILVDSVINSGKSIMEFLVPLRAKHKEVRVIVVAGVVQAKAVEAKEFAEKLDTDPNLTLVALRKSDNKYPGVGVTDTGHRLYNTTYLN